MINLRTRGLNIPSVMDSCVHAISALLNGGRVVKFQIPRVGAGYLEKWALVRADLPPHHATKLGILLVGEAVLTLFVSFLYKQFPERRSIFKALFALVEKEAAGSLAFFLSKVFPSRPATWLDRVLSAIFLAPTAAAHVEMAKRR